MSFLDFDHYAGLALEYSQRHSTQLLSRINRISTSSFALIVLTICIPPIIVLIIFEVNSAQARSKQPKGCRKLGLKIKSNLVNEFDRKFSEGRPPSMEKSSAEWWRVKSLWIYPVKSCKGVELNKSTVLATGMEYDRHFTFAQLKSPFPVSVDTPDDEKAAHKWDFITQRQYPLLATIRTQIWVPDQRVDSYATYNDEVHSGGVIIMSFPSQKVGWHEKLAHLGAAVLGRVLEQEFRVPFDPTAAQIEKIGYKYENLTIWKDTVKALNLEVDIPEELRYYLGLSNKLGLFRVDNQALREVHRCAPKKEELGWQPVTCFQDAYPLHLINLASIRDVESKMPNRKRSNRLSAVRFRANIIITGPEAYEEDKWKKIKIGYYEYAVACRTARCKLPNVNQSTGERHTSEPDKTLRKFRSVDAGAGGNTGCLGMQLVPILQESTIKVGDEVTVLQTGEHFYIKQ